MNTRNESYDEGDLTEVEKKENRWPEPPSRAGAWVGQPAARGASAARERSSGRRKSPGWSENRSEFDELGGEINKVSFLLRLDAGRERKSVQREQKCLAFRTDEWLSFQNRSV